MSAKDKDVNSKRQLTIIVLIILAMILLIAGVFLTLMLINGDNSGDKKDSKSETETVVDDNDEIETDPFEDEDDDYDYTSQYTVPDFDAETYYTTNTNLKTSFDVKTANSLTESEAYQLLNSLGFNSITLTYSYDMDSNYFDACEASWYSGEKHPIYEAVYTTPTGEQWMLNIVNNSIFATPVFYNYSENAKAYYILSLTDTITSYDRGTNKFYVNIPKDNTVIKRVGTISAEFINGLTGEGVVRL